MDKGKLFIHDPRDVIYIENNIIVFGDGPCYLYDSSFLEGVGIDHETRDLVGDDDKDNVIKLDVNESANKFGDIRTKDDDKK
ncbi:hypothetical protein VNO77_26675 [Canavalia gladiata]|uniref:Uncharacterized protein n=1 Tax=Canavalia gladiata TaxID=3824 RepID=A0AAN9Q5S5_CANGL